MIININDKYTSWDYAVFTVEVKIDDRYQFEQYEDIKRRWKIFKERIDSEIESCLDKAEKRDKK